MRSLQAKFIMLILGCVLTCSAVLGGAGIMAADQVVEHDSTYIMNLICSEKAGELDALFNQIKQSTDTLSAYALSRLESLERLKNDGNYRESYIKELEEVAVNAAENTRGALAVYVRFNPEFTTTTSGLFWSRSFEDGRFHETEITDLSKYSPKDMEHVGWYYIPVEQQRAVWMDPYMNKNINVKMISYVVPVYDHGQVVGIVGMDIDFRLITDSVKDMKIYDSGYAFLADRQANVVYHQDVRPGASIDRVEKSLHLLSEELSNESSGQRLFSYSWRGEKKRLAFKSLSNGMRLVITAPASEINADKNRLIRYMGVGFVVITLLSLLITVLLTRRIIRPIKELTEAARKIADGDLSVSLSCRTRDEVGELTGIFQETVGRLKEYINYIHAMAYRDALTGVKNKSAYQDAVSRLEEQMRLGRPEFGVAVFDINNLKQVNDTRGHEYGDVLIVEACRAICGVFKHSPVYRIGGDEFVVILENGDYQNRAAFMEKFREAVRDHNLNSGVDVELSVAGGLAVYDGERDLSYGDVFNRADQAMYENKARQKEYT